MACNCTLCGTLLAAPDMACAVCLPSFYRQQPPDTLDALLDHADAVSREAWARLVGHDATAALHVIGTLIAAVQKELGWPRDRILEEVSEIADDCTETH